MNVISRRDFLKAAAAGASVIAADGLTGLLFKNNSFALDSLGKIGYEHEAMFYEKMDEETVKCKLCPNECVLKDGQRSFCRVREPNNGKLYALNYGQVCSAHIDPIEKKPFYHFLPGTQAFSLATAGCNLRCKFCQNWQISQSRPEDTDNKYLSPKSIVDSAKMAGVPSIAYTYSEPNVFYEYVIDIAKEGRARDLRNVYVTGGYINQEPLSLLCANVDAIKVDFKGFDGKYLKEVCNEDLETVLRVLKYVKKSGVWLELVNLVVPTLNDDMAIIRNMCLWIYDNLGPDVPLHFSRFFPMYKLRNLPQTPLETLMAAHDIAKASGMNYVYVGNVETDKANHTFCPRCGKAVVKRSGYFISEKNMNAGACAFCGYKIAGVWS